MRIKVDLTVAAGSLLLLLLLLLSTCTHSARAIDAECSACEAVGVSTARLFSSHSFRIAHYLLI
jgi:uncharacterized protein YqkB